ncbi:hypothetical protein Hena1_00050 [Erwinia phage Hena1]|uniref:Uncharacterized protein n=1 Tax=Erwinia phage Hena1 TaxID=2678601 RepID=A0A6B9J5K0_9CAUD|nr:hypothetical protein HWC84_gp004 [Erwinia phage Hena1]QGZ16181.1 hypothetical protein Hena1_00050 [Erwinia phage Hena1]
MSQHNWGANSPTCEYVYQSDDGYVMDWKGTCGNVLAIDMGFRGIMSNKPKFNYCHNCGNRLVVQEWESKR